MPTAAQKRRPSGSSRRKMMAAIHIQFQELRPDLRGMMDEERRDERLAFVSNVLGLKYIPASMTELTDRQLGKVLDALRELQSQPRLPHSEVKQAPLAAAEIIHLASAGQVHAINKMLLHLGWGETAKKAFISRRFRRENPVHLRPAQASSLIRILLNIACAQELKEHGFKKVTRQQIRLQIPSLKTRLGIDQPKDAKESEPCQTELI